VSFDRLVALLVVLAVAVAVSVGGAVAGADPGSPDRATAHAVKREKAARCAKQRRAARARRTATARGALKACQAARSTRLSAKKQVAASGPWLAPASAALATVAGTTPTPPGSGDPGSTAPPPPPPGPVASTLGVTAYDMNGFVLRLTKTSVPAGTLTIFFRNGDVSDHNLWISSPDGETVERISDAVGLDGGASRTLPVTAGTWRLFCSLPDHDAMTRTLTVAP
jgi:hypothetical protein